MGHSFLLMSVNNVHCSQHAIYLEVARMAFYCYFSKGHKNWKLSLYVVSIDIDTMREITPFTQNGPFL